MLPSLLPHSSCQSKEEGWWRDDTQREKSVAYIQKLITEINRLCLAVWLPIMHPLKYVVGQYVRTLQPLTVSQTANVLLEMERMPCSLYKQTHQVIRGYNL